MATSRPMTPRRLSSRTTLQRMSVEENISASGQPGTAIIIHTDPSSMSTVDSQGRVGLSSLQTVVPRRWATLETAKRFLLVLSVAFLILGVVMTAVGFAARPRNQPTQSSAYLALQVAGPVCLILSALCPRRWSCMSGYHGGHVGARGSVLATVEGGVESSSARHGATRPRKTSRTCDGHDEETDRVAKSSTRSHTSTRSASVASSAKRHGHQVMRHICVF